MVKHHLDDATLMSFASGTANTAIAVAVSAHLEMCPTCRERLKTIEAAGGAMLESVETSALSQGSVNDLLEMLDASLRAPQAQKPKAISIPKKSGGLFPSSVAGLVGDDPEKVAWKKVGAGVSLHRISLDDKNSDEQGRLFLMKIEAGRKMPEHGHGANELTLVLSGAYSDEVGTFRRGDVADLDPETEHQPVVHDDASCICLVAIEEPTRFKGIIPRLMQPYIGL
ncbi:MAG: ChrR family anti-sigma-E factor [Pseudomonadota bacterium]